MNDSSTEYWDVRYREGRTGWDIGYASPALLAYCKTKAVTTRILIPGAGNAYEWIALKGLGFDDVTVLDISNLPIDRLKKEFPESKNKLIHGDYFEHEGEYDLILEQTFFCAIDPSLRTKHIEKAYNLLRPGGKLVGLLFDRTFEKPGPPHGGTLSEYQSLLSTQFDSLTLEACTQSIPERAGTELFFIASKD